MKQFIGAVTVVVDDYTRAVAYYRDVLGFDLVADEDMGGGKRWVMVAPPGSRETRLLLAKAADERQRSRVGDQTGGRVFLFLHTDDFQSDYTRLKNSGTRFLEAPRREVYGTVAVFEDPFGNRWDLLQPAG